MDAASFRQHPEKTSEQTHTCHFAVKRISQFRCSAVFCHDRGHYSWVHHHCIHLLFLLNILFDNQFLVVVVLGMHKRMRLPRPVVRAMDYMDAHLHDKLSLKEIAEYADLAPAYLSDLFHKETGLTVTGYILRRRIQAAKNMLIDTDQKIAEIAEVLAFSNASHFQRLFKKETGYTPHQYRQFGDNVESRDAARII